MNTARYVVALLSVVMYPAAVGWWYVTHPFVRFWRRIGRPLYYVVITVGASALMALIYAVSDPLLAVEYGTNRHLWPFVVVIYGAALYVEIRCRKHLKASILFGAPELEKSGHGGRLIEEGIYARIRHPRYVSVWLGTWAAALFTNYLAVYVLAALAAPALNWVAILEERELRNRFGQKYAAYCQRVPRRFIPRFRA